MFAAVGILIAIHAPPSGIGDPTFPNLGNRGYRATHYDIRLKYDVAKNWLDADVTMTATTESKLETFSVDFVGFQVRKALLDGHPANFERKGEKMIVKAADPIDKGAEFHLETTYEGMPRQLETEALNGEKAGWIHYADGAVTVCEPNLAHTWFPCNDHPRDKATFDFQIQSPPGYAAIANGLETQKETNSLHQARWHEDKPIQTCMAIVAIGKYSSTERTGPDNLPIRDYFPSSRSESSAVAQDPKYLALLESKLGPYPWSSYGTLELPSDVASVNSLMAGSALETVGLPVFGPGGASSRTELIHEMAHQWMGDCVSITDWGDDIWWVEGFATFAQYLRIEAEQGRDAYDKALSQMYRQFSGGIGWVPPGHLTAGQMFSGASYQGGCLVFYALRRELGDEPFFAMLRKFVAAHRYGNATTEDWIEAASKAAARDMRPFFEAWLYARRIPPIGAPG